MTEREHSTLLDLARDEWQTTMDRVSMHRAWPIPTILRALTTPQYLDLRCEIRVRDIRTGEPTKVHIRELLSVAESALMSDDDRLEFVIHMVRRAIEHELDECLLVDGRQHRNPHISIWEPCPEHPAGCRITAVDTESGLRFSCSTDNTLRRG